MKPSSSKDSGEIEYLSEISPRDKPWDTRRSQSEDISKLYLSIGYEKYADRMDNCARTLKFCLESKTSEEMKLRLREARFCRVRHCVVCQGRRSMSWRARFFTAMPKIQAEYPTGQWLFLTLTVRNCEITDLRKTLDHMNKSWIRLTQRKEFPALGYVKSVEVTRGQGGTAHPHFHCLLLVKSSYFKTGYVSQEKWTNLWQSCLRIDYTPIINIQRVKVKGSLKKSSLATDDSQDGITKAICETFKYSVKGSDLIKDAEWLKELTNQLHKTKGITIGGCLRSFIEEKEPENLIDTGLEDEEKTGELKDDEIMLIFEWASVVRRYQHSRQL
jgi:plasmid rolling circle replication initiator protein Rep